MQWSKAVCPTLSQTGPTQPRWHPGRRATGRSPRNRSAIASPTSPERVVGAEFGILKTLKRLWIPLVILAVIAAGGFAVSKLRSVFGTEQHIPYSDTQAEDAKPIDPKYMRYEISGRREPWP